MMIVEMMNGNRHRITKQEYERFNTIGSDLIRIPSCNVVLNKKSIVEIYDEENAPENSKKSEVYYLHDGTKAVRHFGRFVALGSEQPDDKGNFKPVELDAEYYPEVALDCVATRKQWLEISAKKIDYYEYFKIDKNKKLIGNSSFTKLIA